LINAAIRLQSKDPKFAEIKGKGKEALQLSKDLAKDKLNEVRQLSPSH
jgi:hypothetical protein